jgi:hypothetical protein
MLGYRYVLDCDVAEALLESSARQRATFVRIFRRLAEAPNQAGEWTFKDSAGRSIQKKRFDRWLVCYWADHAVREIRIVGIQKANR